MIHVARLELCQALYELSGWNETSFVHECFPDGAYHTTLYVGLTESYSKNLYYPAYDLSYLLHRLPHTCNLYPIAGAMWEIQYTPWNSIRAFAFQEETLEDAACRLAIELFKRGILERKDE